MVIGECVCVGRKDKREGVRGLSVVVVVVWGMRGLGLGGREERVGMPRKMFYFFVVVCYYTIQKLIILIINNYSLYYLYNLILFKILFNLNYFTL